MSDTPAPQEYIIVEDGVPRPMTPEEIAAIPMTTSVFIPPITRRQLLLILPQIGVITAQEAIAAARTGEVPAAIQSFFALLSDADRLAAEITWATMSVCERSNPLLLGLAAQLGMSDAQVDDFFRMAAAL